MKKSLFVMLVIVLLVSCMSIGESATTGDINVSGTVLVPKESK